MSNSVYGAKKLILLSCVVFAMALPSSAHAYLVSATTGWGLGTGAATEGIKDGGVSASKNTDIDPAGHPLPVVSSSNTVTFAPLATVWTANMQARASTTELGVRQSLALTGFDSSINGLLNQFAGASYRDIFTFSATTTDPFYLSPIFDLQGSLSATPGIGINLGMSYVFNTVGVPGTSVFGSLFDANAPADGSTLVVNENVAPTPYVTVDGARVQLEIGLFADIMNLGLNTLSDGEDYFAMADFYGTAGFLGFAVYSDPEFTQLVLSGITITSDDGSTIPVIDPESLAQVPLPSALGLFAAALLGLGVRRRRCA